MPGGQIVRILIIDDDQDDFIITGDYIKHIQGLSSVIDWCNNYDDALKAMIAKKYDLYFVDYRLGAKSGVDLLHDALEHQCEEPIILLTGKGSYHVDIAAMESGAVDYLIKTELNVEKMERSIRYALGRAKTLKALKANERKYKGIFERSKDVIFLADEDLNFIDVNDAISTLLGYTREEALQMNLLDIVEQAQHKKYLQQVLSINNEVEDWEVSLLNKTNERKYCILTAAQEEGTEGKIYFQGIIHDITNLKKVEKANLRAEKLAATGRLVRTLAHEVRNPLNNITLSVEQMLQEAAADNMYLDIIDRNSKRINDLISELLSSARPAEMAMQQHILQNIIDEVVGMAMDRLTLKKIKLDLSYPDVPLVLNADKEKLKIALLNIIINAIEAMEEQEGHLAISLEEREQAFALRIADNGCGISEENITRLFEPYFTQKRNGMGLGLAATLNILQSHNANIEVASTEGEGTTFTIIFSTEAA